LNLKKGQWQVLLRSKISFAAQGGEEEEVVMVIAEAKRIRMMYGKRAVTSKFPVHSIL
jgi:hypothetical protein